MLPGQLICCKGSTSKERRSETLSRGLARPLHTPHNLFRYFIGLPLQCKKNYYKKKVPTFKSFINSNWLRLITNKIKPSFVKSSLFC